jgi:hypothetical protein
MADLHSSTFVLVPAAPDSPSSLIGLLEHRVYAVEVLRPSPRDQRPSPM